MAFWILRIFSLGRGLHDSVAVALSALPLFLLGFSNILPVEAILVGSGIGLYFLIQTFIRLQVRNNQRLASQRRFDKSTQWAQNFIVQHLSEIRRPLQGLIGVREVYAFNFENKDTQEYLEIVNHCSEHVIRLINRLQLYSDLKSEVYYNKEVRFTLAHILKDALKAAEASNPGKVVTVDQHISPKVLRDYFGSYELIRALILEVIHNSIRYSPRADIEISADCSKAENQNLVIRIRDRGPGIQKSIQDKLQAKLDRKASSFDLKSDSEGLGVPLIRSLVQHLSAKINIKSVKGEGTEFEIHLRVPAYNTHIAHLKKKNHANQSSQILIVEDDPLAQKIIAAILKRLGYRSTIVSNGHDAVELCRRQKFGFILMDLEMPIMDGWEASAHILSNCKKPEDRPMIVALTAQNSPADRERAEKAGCHIFLTKPINKEQLSTHLLEAGISSHFPPNTTYHEKSFDGLELLAGKTVDFKKMYSHYNHDMGLCQIILTQAVQSLPGLLDKLDSCILNRDKAEIDRCMHQLIGELRALICNSGVHLVERLKNHDDLDNMEFISDLEQLNRYCESLLKELSVLAKHNEVMV